MLVLNIQSTIALMLSRKCILQSIYIVVKKQLFSIHLEFVTSRRFTEIIYKKQTIYLVVPTTAYAILQCVFAMGSKTLLSSVT